MRTATHVDLLECGRNIAVAAENLSNAATAGQAANTRQYLERLQSLTSQCAEILRRADGEALYDQDLT